MYHIVCPAKYRRAIFTEEVDNALKEICEEISKRYEIVFLEIGTDSDHVHFLVQSVPMYSPKKIVQIIKSITAREIFKKCPISKETTLGWRIVVRWLLCDNSRKAWRRRRNKELCQKSRR